METDENDSVHPAHGTGVDWNEFHDNTRYPNATEYQHKMTYMSNMRTEYGGYHTYHATMVVRSTPAIYTCCKRSTMTFQTGVVQKSWTALSLSLIMP